MCDLTFIPGNANLSRICNDAENGIQNGILRLLCQMAAMYGLPFTSIEPPLLLSQPDRQMIQDRLRAERQLPFLSIHLLNAWTGSLIM